MKNRRLLAILLTGCMLLGLFPAEAFADEVPEGGETVVEGSTYTIEEDTTLQEPKTNDDSDEGGKNGEALEKTETEDCEHEWNVEEVEVGTGTVEETGIRVGTVEEVEFKIGTAEEDPEVMPLADAVIGVKAVCVAEVAGEEYATLQAAIAAAANGDTVTLLQNADIKTVENGKTNYHLSIQGKTITLDLNGCTASGGYIYVNGANAGLILKDGSESQKGRINSDKADNYSIFVSDGFVIVSGGTVSGSGSGVYVKGAGIANVTGGTVIGSNGIYVKDNGTANVTSGTVNGTNGIYIKDKGFVNVTGGTVDGGMYGIYAAGGTVTVTKGEIIGGVDGILAEGADTTVTVGGNGAEVGAAAVKGGDHRGVWVRKGAVLNVRDGADIAGKDNGIALIKENATDEGGGTVRMTGGEVSCENFYGIVCEDLKGTDRTVIAISGGEISGRLTGIYHLQAEGTVTVSGGRISGYTGIEMRAGTLEIPEGSDAVVTGDYTIDGIHYGFGSSPNGSGYTTCGAGVAVSQHTSNADLSVRIAGGTLQGYFALYEQDLQDQETSNISLLVTGGQFECITYGSYSPDPQRGENSTYGGYDVQIEGYETPVAVKVMDCTEFVTGGTFCSDVTEYCAESCVSHRVSTPEGCYNVHEPQNGDLYDETCHWQGCVGHADCIEGKTELIPHEWDDGEVTKAATCNEVGTMTYTCECGATRTGEIEIDKLAHIGEEIPAEAATCERAGSTAGVKCSVCGEVLTAPETVEALGHDFTGDHAHDETNHWHICAREGCEAADTAAAHTFGDWVTDTPAQVGVAGSRHRVCSLCEYREDGTIAALTGGSTGGGSTGGGSTGGGSTGGGSTGGGSTGGGTAGGGSTGGGTAGGSSTSGDSTGDVTPTTDPAEEDLTENDVPLIQRPMLFTDVTENNWFYTAVRFVFERDMMKGTNKAETLFDPNMTTTRGMIVTILHRMEGEPEAAVSTFSDVGRNAWYTAAVDWAAANGVVEGYGDGSFRPERTITREEMAAILSRYASFKGCDKSAVGDVEIYDDKNRISKWARRDMSWAVGAKVLSGRGNNILDPVGTASRADAAQMLKNFCEQVLAPGGVQV